MLDMHTSLSDLNSNRMRHMSHHQEDGSTRGESKDLLDRTTTHPLVPVYFDQFHTVCMEATRITD